MAYNLKTYKEFITSAVEPADTQIFRTTPFLIAEVGSDYIYSKLKIDSPKEHSNFPSIIMNYK